MASYGVSRQTAASAEKIRAVWSDPSTRSVEPVVRLLDGLATHCENTG